MPANAPDRMLNTLTLIDEREADAEPLVHHTPVGASDYAALAFTKLLRIIADTFFAKRYGHRA